ncbi:MurT ligase domain-containing protein [Dolosicoccus paucivorans]|uniref:Lipid II isoglutaminyl synthase (glutamine-hydrolyzing) subunit MurT n=1 Tax=Dolosicoccus paucivorans TaxID=84521 RepID=A0A1G8NVP9_9LACT|nr:MurT ligase domain-containing protein [Dolosicoccus paucivorans]PMB84856.1 DUF1727 domain-containing protein [Dolosicoccus paucivorans]PMC58852.1 DUF1727 domain-containing protein [Dolosicoccus paucivorans]SDI84299.1 UDP-N-acetylmuramoyl-L-alanyl-D-glutamate--2,6-diaminopimelate ligase [Dolosicoccus paucivorans]
MKFRTRFAKSIARLAQITLQKTTGGGSSLPGKIATAIDPQILSHIAKDYDVVVITGTNGKTLTTALTAHIFEKNGQPFITNQTGSNMLQGIVAAFIEAKTPSDKRPIAVLEVDEGSLKHVVPHVQPKAFIFTNLFEDQADRFSSVEAVYELLLDAAKSVPEATVFMNGDLPLFAEHDLPNPVVYFGTQVNTGGAFEETSCPRCGKTLDYYTHTFSNLGHYYCSHCGFKRPELTYSVEEIVETTPHYSVFMINGTTFRLPFGGVYNIYNALAAFSLADHWGVDPETIAVSFNEVQDVSGRQEEIQLDDKHLTINLAKNTVGMNQLLELLKLDEEPFTFVNLQNDQYADGQDIQWIWEANYHALTKLPIPQIITGGTRAQDLKKRLLEEKIDPSIIYVASSMEEVLEAIKQAPTDKVHLLGSYTATIEFRNLLKEKHYL